MEIVADEQRLRKEIRVSNNGSIERVIIRGRPGGGDVSCKNGVEDGLFSNASSEKSDFKSSVWNWRPLLAYLSFIQTTTLP